MDPKDKQWWKEKQTKDYEAARDRSLEEQRKLSREFTKPDSNKGGGNCFVATAAFGDYDAPEVVFLRKYRDESLSQSAAGRAFIHAYYAFSPSLAMVIAKSVFLRAVARKFFLQPMIFLLQNFKR